jgi:hypothetical protein
MIIKDILKYGKGLVGISRGSCENKFKPFSIDKAPFWLGDENPPPNKLIKRYGINCSGLINLLRRYAGLPVSVILNKKIGLGGTGEWFSYLKSKKRLKPFDICKSYPAGTMLLRNYNPIDSGHCAVIYKENKRGVLYSSLLHSVGWFDKSKKKIVKIDNIVADSHFYQYNGTTNIGHYTHICLPSDWLIKV